MCKLSQAGSQLTQCRGSNWHEDSDLLTICSGSKDEELGGTSVTNCENTPKKIQQDIIMIKLAPYAC